MALYCSPKCQTSFESLGPSVQEKKFRINFQDSNCGGHLRFRIEMILAIFDLSHPDTSYQRSCQVTFWFRRSSK